MAKYNFGPKLTTSKGYTIQIDADAEYGYWEYPDGTEGGGLWFFTNPDCPKKLELSDFDGAFELHQSVVDKLREEGYVVHEDFNA